LAGSSILLGWKSCSSLAVLSVLVWLASRHCWLWGMSEVCLVARHDWLVLSFRYAHSPWHGLAWILASWAWCLLPHSGSLTLL
jgi:hypothetical protein